jgi:cation diffusion facilitator CzcD-associated flavoprotein CzcO
MGAAKRGCWMRSVETDYLVVGAGPAGMAFADALIAGSESTVVMVDRTPVPGGYWNDGYAFVRLQRVVSDAALRKEDLSE